LPLYEYRCTQCGHRFEKIQSFSAVPETVCPKCGGTLERPLTAPALQFKGAGWYVNDYAPKSSGSSSDDKPTGEGASTAAGDSKPAPESKPVSESKSAPESAAKPTSSTSTTP
jgi:putative FmdB family regulatory protein